jgi:hypothetical protein
MELDRRQLLLALGMASVSGIAGTASAGLTQTGQPKCHQLTRSLIDRARRASSASTTMDALAIERVIRRVMTLGGNHHGRPIIKWIADPAGAFDLLKRRDLADLMEMGPTTLWRAAQHPFQQDEEAFERSFLVRQLLFDILEPDEHDRILMGPKLRAISDTRCAGASAEELFLVRAVLSQIGWLETSLPAVATNAIEEVDALLCSGASADSDAVQHRLMTFEAYEKGLLATWEMPDEIICVPRLAVRS